MPANTFSDAKLGPDGDLPDFTELITGIDALVQRVVFRLQVHFGEWFADPTAGLPWEQWQRIKNLPPGLVSSKIRIALETVPGIDSVRRVLVVPAPEIRSMLIALDLIVGRDTVELGFDVEPPGRSGNVSFYVRYRRLGSNIQRVGP